MTKRLAALLAFCFLLPFHAHSASGNPLDSSDDAWRFTVAFPMIWAPDIKGKIRGGRHQDFDIPFDQILQSLDFGLMGELYATRGPFGLAFRFNYMDLEANKTPEGGLIQTEVDVDITAGINDLLASWRVHEKVRILTGIRHVHNKVVLNVESRINDTVILNESIKVSDDDAFDLLFGMTFDHWFTPRWGIMINGDLGILGDNDRDFSAEF